MRMLTSTSRRFTRRNDYRLGRSASGGIRTKDRIRVVRPEGTPSFRSVAEVTPIGRCDCAELPSAA